MKHTNDPAFCAPYIVFILSLLLPCIIQAQTHITITGDVYAKKSNSLHASTSGSAALLQLLPLTSAASCGDLHLGELGPIINAELASFETAENRRFRLTARVVLGV